MWCGAQALTQHFGGHTTTTEARTHTHTHSQRARGSRSNGTTATQGGGRGGQQMDINNFATSIFIVAELLKNVSFGNSHVRRVGTGSRTQRAIEGNASRTTYQWLSHGTVFGTSVALVLAPYQHSTTYKALHGRSIGSPLQCFPPLFALGLWDNVENAHELRPLAGAKAISVSHHPSSVRSVRRTVAEPLENWNPCVQTLN